MLTVQAGQVVLIVIVSVLLGWQPVVTAVSVLSALLLILAGSAAFSGLAMLMAGTLRAEATLAAANLVYLVLLGVGGVVFPLSKFPPPPGRCCGCCRPARCRTACGRCCATAPACRSGTSSCSASGRSSASAWPRAPSAGSSGAARPRIGDRAAVSSSRPPPRRNPLSRVPPPLLLGTGIISVQVGAGLAARMFGTVTAAGLTGVRLWAAALMLAGLGARPTIRAIRGVLAERAWRDAAWCSRSASRSAS